MPIIPMPQYHLIGLELVPLIYFQILCQPRVFLKNAKAEVEESARTKNFKRPS